MSELKPITVTQLSDYIKQIFDAEELLHNVRVLGEVSGIKIIRGVAYFSFKDENATLNCVSFLDHVVSKLNEGDSVILTGSPTFYTKSGKLNFIVINIQPFGQGALYQKFLDLKDKLAEEGLFDQKFKKYLPTDVKRIGVVTSREGAVIRDIINVTSRRNPNIDIVLYPVRVQGINAEIEIAKGIQAMSDYDKIDVLIVARGGGSLEELMPFNSEIVARAAFKCNKPLISAVGHETDFTIIDFVADLRAPTPSAAAEIVTNDLMECKLKVNLLLKRFKIVSDKFINDLKNDLFSYKEDMINLYEDKLEQENYKLKLNILKLSSICDNNINEKIYELNMLDQSLKNNSPIKILQMGYAKIEQENKNIKTRKELDINNDFIVNFYDGKVVAKAKK